MNPDNLSAGQFNYRFHQHTQGGEEHITVAAFHPETGEGVAMATFGRDPSQTKKEIKAGRSKDRFEPRVAYTRPEYQRRGIGTTMLNVARYEQPGLSQPIEPTRALSPMGLEFSKKYFGTEASLPSRPTTGAWINTDKVDEAIRSGSAPAMQLATGESSRQSELARGLVPKMPGQSGEPEPKTTQGTMFRKVKGQEVPVKSALPKK